VKKRYARRSSSIRIRFLVCEGHIDAVLGYIDSKDVLKRLLKGEQFSLADKGLVHTPLSIPDSLNLWEVLERMKAMDEDLAIVVNEYALVVGIISITDVTGVLMGNLLAMAEEEQQIVRRDENSWLMDGLTPLNDVMNELDIDEYPNPVGYETLPASSCTCCARFPRRPISCCSRTSSSRWWISRAIASTSCW
jgi:CBS domain containing-hemolysin-like protein